MYILQKESKILTLMGSISLVHSWKYNWLIWNINQKLSRQYHDDYKTKDNITVCQKSHSLLLPQFAYLHHPIEPHLEPYRKFVDKRKVKKGKVGSKYYEKVWHSVLQMAWLLPVRQMVTKLMDKEYHGKTINGKYSSVY